MNRIKSRIDRNGKLLGGEGKNRRQCNSMAVDSGIGKTAPLVNTGDEFIREDTVGYACENVQ